MGQIWSNNRISVHCQIRVNPRILFQSNRKPSLRALIRGLIEVIYNSCNHKDLFKQGSSQLTLHPFVRSQMKRQFNPKVNLQRPQDNSIRTEEANQLCIIAQLKKTRWIIYEVYQYPNLTFQSNIYKMNYFFYPSVYLFTHFKIYKYSVALLKRFDLSSKYIVSC